MSPVLPNSVSLWHGAQKWDGPVQVRPGKAKCSEYGPGFYMTNYVERAASYAKGAGSLVLVSLDHELSWLEDARRPMSVLREGVKDLLGPTARRSLLVDLEAAGARHESHAVPVSYLINLMVNSDLLRGKRSPEVAAWLIAQGIDASCHIQGRNYGYEFRENYVVLFNPNKVVSVLKMKRDEAYALGSFEEAHRQIAQCQRVSEASSLTMKPSESTAPRFSR